MLPPDNNPSPYAQIHQFDVEKDTNSPVIVYVRQPGMIIEYDITGSWTHGLPKTDNDHYIIGLFVANSKNTLKNAPQHLSLEEYLRKSEKADHTSWIDWNIGDYKPNIVSKIQKQIKRHLTGKYENSRKEHEERRNFGLGKKLADLLLPPENFGSMASPVRKTTSTTHKPGTTRGYGLKLIGPVSLKDGKYNQDFELTCNENLKGCIVQLQVETETGAMNADVWEGEGAIGKPFPLRLEALVISGIKRNKKMISLADSDIVIDAARSSHEFENVDIQMVKTQKYGVSYAVKFAGKGLEKTSFYGTISFSSSDVKISGALELIPIKGDNG